MLSTLKNKPNKASQFLTIQEVCDLLCCKKDFIYGLIGDGKLKTYQMSPKMRRVKVSDYEAYIKSLEI
jgi:DNA binding domain, excisionase family